MAQSYFQSKQSNPIHTYPYSPSAYNTLILIIPIDWSPIIMQCSSFCVFKLMSGKFSSTGSTGGSALFKQEEFIREIVQNEMLLVFEDIKLEIEAKIKSIDRNITDLRNEVRCIAEQHHLVPPSLPAELLQRMERLEAQVQILKYHHQNTLKVSRTKSLDKERKPIFKRDDSQVDFSSIVLGLDHDPPRSDSLIAPTAKPPLPKDNSKPKQQESKGTTQGRGLGEGKGVGESKSDPNIRREERGFKRNPVLQDTGSIHRWLTENNNRESSCFSSIIREEEIEESIFY